MSHKFELWVIKVLEQGHIYFGVLLGGLKQQQEKWLYL